MSNINEITIRLEKLKEYYGILKGLQKQDLNYFKKDLVVKGGLERYMQLSAETAMDIGEIIISELGLKSPMFHKEIFKILGEEKILSKKLANTFFEIAKFRNKLVHDYIEIDLEDMYKYLQNDLDDFKKYIQAISKFLRKKYDF